MADLTIDEASEVVIRDGTTSSNELTINADGSINTTTADVYVSATFDSVGDTVTIPLAGKQSVGFQLQPGGLTARLIAEVSFNGGLTWNTATFRDLDGSIQNELLPVNPNPAIARTITLLGGVTHARVRVTSHTTGAAVIDAKAVVVPQPSINDGAYGSGSISTLNGAVTIPTNGRGNTAFNVTGTWVATLSFQGSVDYGATYTSIIANLTAQAVTTVLTANNRALVSCSGYTHIRLIATAYTSGTAVITWGTGPVNQVYQVWNTNSASLQSAVSGPIAAGAADSGNPVKIGGKFNSTLPTLTNGQRGDAQLDASSRLLVVCSPTGTLSNGAETTVSSSAVQVISANSNRRQLIIQNNGAGNVRIGASGVTSTTGVRLSTNALLILTAPGCPTNAIFAIRETVNSTVLAQEIV